MNKVYKSYKESSIDWLGKIPIHWDESRIKKYFNERNEKVNDIEYPPLSVTKSGILPQLENVSKSDNHNDRKRVCINDFVINSRSDRKGSSGLSQLDGSVSLINIVLEPKNINPIFSEYLFKSKDFIEEFFRNGKGIHWDLWSTRYSELQNIKIPIPPLPEQQQIVSFLDSKTSLIDSLIEKTQRKIELLKEKRTSLINEVVTKGLNPNVKMKDSGVEWIGEIPSHWERVKLKYVCSVTTGGKDTQDKVEDGLYPFYVRSPKIERINSYSYEGESVLTVGDGVGVGKVFHYVDGKFEFHQRVYKFSDFKRLTGKFFYWFIKHHFIFVTEDQNSKSTVDSLRRPLIDEFPFVNPPLSEQQQIVEYLDEQTQLIDKTISIEEKRIQLLKEYRQSLISEVVTGKRKVV